MTYYADSSVDILHVAVAKALRAAKFISFDGRKHLLATALGLKVTL
jgi:predicted nucleic acid-binding protein